MNKEQMIDCLKRARSLLLDALEHHRKGNTLKANGIFHQLGGYLDGSIEGLELQKEATKL